MPRRFAFSILLPALLGATGCFAFFPLDDYQAGVATSVDGGLDTGATSSSSGDAAADSGQIDAAAFEGKRIIFVTEAKVTGSIGGLAKADDICAAAAAQVGFGGTFKAILGSSTAPAAIRFLAGEVTGGRTPLPIVDTTGQAIADSYSALFEKGPTNAIRRDEKGQGIPGSVSVSNGTVACTDATPIVWTGSNATGTSKDNDCDDFDSPTPKDNGVVGVASLKPQWLQACTVSCSMQAHLYCGQL